ncbi:hypothetical protein E1176_07915 [Fulvivirga sp. RKSG066]|uniref:hypothetical protein n=1 Tax=Fulvivirga aurantia TaxID=2529383 RepID=UPI0012BC26CA|nr:hypothetical protein [Fulvivirga aurantia]MTI20944.1 hypothetical protein [Fulvivirga aurantia]
MKRIKYIAIVWLLFVGSAVIAQTTPEEYAKQYTGAHLLFSQGKYSLAMEAFKPLIKSDENNPFANYSSFYYALSAYRQGYVPMAKDMLLQVKQLYPKWSKIDEVNLWLAQIYFEQEEFNSALNILKSVKNKRSRDFIVDLKRYHITGIENLNTLKSLHKNNSEDEVVARVLAKRIAALPLADRDQELLERLIEDFDLDPEILNVSLVTKTVFKDSYKVAVILPFVVDKLEPVDKPKVNQFVLDIYEGIRLAVDSLKDSGIDIQLFAYDTKRDSVATSKILAKEEMKGMDLIIGPLYAKPIELVTQFAYTNQINVINPLFSNTDIIGKNPYSFLFKPGSEQVGVEAAKYVAKNARNKVGIIFYEDSKSDSTMAYSYKQRIEKDSFNIIMTQKIRKDESRAILDLLLISDEKIKEASTEEARSNYTIGIDSIGHIFVASDNDLISTKVISAVETRGDSITVIGSAEWMELPVINYETYGRLKTVLYAPAYMPKDTLGFKNFRNRYLKKHKKSPNKYVASGFELMMLMGKSLDKHGKYFQIGWGEEGFMPGFISYGYNFNQSNSNQLVPILRFDDEEMEVILNQEERDGDIEK